MKKKSQVLPFFLSAANPCQQYKGWVLDCWLGHSLEHTVRSKPEQRSRRTSWPGGRGRCWLRFTSNRGGAAPATPTPTLRLTAAAAPFRYSTVRFLLLL